MKGAALLLLFSALLASTAEGLRFGHDPVTVDTGVLVVGQPSRLTCNYVKYRTESVREIGWYIGYPGFSSRVFLLNVVNGRKEGSAYPFVRTDDSSATESELTITLTEPRSNNFTIGCEIEVIRDEGYGKVKTNKRLGESQVSAVSGSGGHGGLGRQMAVTREGSFEVGPGKELIVRCVSRGNDKAPRLALSIGGRNFSEIYTGTVEDASGSLYSSGGSSRDVAVVGRLRETPSELFDRGSGQLVVLCSASYDGYPVDRKELVLYAAGSDEDSDHDSAGGAYDSGIRSKYGRHGGHDRPASANSYGAEHRKGRRNDDGTDDYSSPVMYSGNDDYSRRTGSSSSSSSYPSASLYPGSGASSSSAYPADSGSRHGRLDGGYDADVVHAKLFDLVDPARHVHPGIPYDFFSGYILMLASDIINEQNPQVLLMGELPFEVESGLIQKNYGKYEKEGTNKLLVKSEAARMLNQMGQFGYRVVSSSPIGANAYVWTLEKRNFDAVANRGQQQQQQQPY